MKSLDKLGSLLLNLLKGKHSYSLHKKLLSLDSFSLHLVDVGAADGIPTEFLWLKNDLEVVCFEPDKRSCLELKKKLALTGIKKFSVEPFALASKNEIRDFFLTEKPTCSSMYRPNEKIAELYEIADKMLLKEKTQVHCRPLDDCIEHTDWIKVDAQGFELSILSGATKVLKNCIGVTCEAEFFSMYEDQPLFSEVELFLRSKGFQVVGVKTHGKREAYLDYHINCLMGEKTNMYCDAIFLNSKYLPYNINNAVSSLEILKVFLFLLSYKKVALAMAIALTAKKLEILESSHEAIILDIFNDNGIQGSWLNLFKLGIQFKYRKINFNKLESLSHIELQNEHIQYVP